MNVLKAMNFNGTAVVDSRQVAEAIGKKHNKLLRDIRTYCEYLGESKIGHSDLGELKIEPVNQSKIGLVNELKIELVNFFIESTYTDSKGEKRLCYLCTQKGCEMIAHKLTGKKGVIFTALYINAFHRMEKQKCIDCRIFEKLEDINANVNSLRTEISETFNEKPLNDDNFRIINKKGGYNMNDNKERLKPFLIDYIQEITTKSKGKDQYICPFCNSGTGRNGTGAFTYYSNTHSYNCFACGEYGDIFTLHAKLNNLSIDNDFIQIVNELEKKYNLPSSNYGNTPSNSNSLLQLRSHVYMNMNRDKIAVKTIYKKLDGSKTARWERYEGNTLVKNLNGLQMPLYHVYNLTNNTKPVFIVEGEKDVETMEKLGYIATTSPNGAGSRWKESYTECIKGFDVIILADNDEVGLKYATNIAESIIQTARSVKLVPSQALYEPLKPKGDISDIVECIGSEKAVQLIESILNSSAYIFTSKPSSESQQVSTSKKRQIITYELFSEFLEKQGYSIRYNQITHNFEFFGFDESESKEHLAENVPTILHDQLKLIYTHVTKQVIMDYITRYATRNRYNPILSAIKAVKWDGKDRVGQIYDIFRIPADTEEGLYSRIFIFKWLKQCVCGLFNDIENPFSLDIILVFQGKQGIGKTRFFEMLALNSKFFGEGICLDPRDKDSIIQATSKWISELGELGSTMRKDMDSVKAFLTKSTDEYRTPYGKASLHYPRMTSFVGTVNDEQFLIDQTGNRRFVTIPLAFDLVIDYNTQIKPFDALQLWSQIYHIVKNEDKASCFRLDEEEKRYLEKRNSAFVKPMKSECEVLDILEEQQTPQQGYTCTFKEMTVLQFIQLHNLKYDANVVGRVLKKYGYKTIRKRINGEITRVIRLPYKYYSQSYN
ncbi:MAG: Rha family transcriptional regulator [Ruminococcus sp.]|nr:Rha family transcriptional regulator [Ruminococcus sp.]